MGASRWELPFDLVFIIYSIRQTKKGSQLLDLYDPGFDLPSLYTS